MRWPSSPASPRSEHSEGPRTDWRPLLEKELQIAREVQGQVPALDQREAEQAVVAVFLHSQPIGHKANTPELVRMVGAGAPDGIELEKALGGWRDLSWFLDDADAVDDDTGSHPQVLAPRQPSQPEADARRGVCAARERHRRWSSGWRRRFAARDASARGFRERERGHTSCRNLHGTSPTTASSATRCSARRRYRTPASRARWRADTSPRPPDRTGRACTAMSSCWRCRPATASRRRATRSARCSAGRTCRLSSTGTAWTRFRANA